MHVCSFLYSTTGRDAVRPQEMQFVVGDALRPDGRIDLRALTTAIRPLDITSPPLVGALYLLPPFFCYSLLFINRIFCGSVTVYVF